MLQNAARESRPLRRRQIDSQSGPLHLFKGPANSRIRLASEESTFTIVLTIGRYCLANSAVAIWLQQRLHQVFKRWPDRASYVEGFIRVMSKGAQCSNAARKNAGL